MRVAGAWILYLAGHICSIGMNRLRLPIYPIYNRLMCLSSHVQGESGRGPWRAADEAVQ